MASDPIGSIGTTGQQDNDLALATKGGPKFMARLQQLADATDRHEHALAQLKLGQDAVAAFDEAQRKRAEAEELRKQAAKALADAEAKVKKIIEAANAELKGAAESTAAANSLQREATKRLERVEARETAAKAEMAKTERATVDANKVRDQFQSKINRLVSAISEAEAALQ